MNRPPSSILPFALALVVGAALALLLLPTLAVGGSASPMAPTASAATRGSGAAVTAAPCVVSAQLQVPTRAVMDQPAVLLTLLHASGASPACQVRGATYVYTGLPPMAGGVANAPMLVVTSLVPGLFHVVVIVHGTFGTTVAAATLNVGVAA
jgi:hypothetical protein